MATDGSLLGMTGEWGAWAVVQLDYDEEMWPLHGMYGSVEAEFEVQRTIKRAELTAFLCLVKRVIGPITKGSSMDYGDGRERERVHEAKSGRCRFVDQKFGKNCIIWQKGAFWWQVEHVKVHRTKK